MLLIKPIVNWDSSLTSKEIILFLFFCVRDFEGERFSSGTVGKGKQSLNIIDAGLNCGVTYCYFFFFFFLFFSSISLFCLVSFRRLLMGLVVLGAVEQSTASSIKLIADKAALCSTRKTSDLL